MRPSELSRLAQELFPDGPLLVRKMQHWRPYICPFELLVEAVPPRATVLDIGCGGGLFLALLSRLRDDVRGEGVDNSPLAIRCAQALARDRGLPVRFEQRDLERGDWPDGEWDVVSIIDVLHHIAPGKQREVLVKAASRVKRGGILIYKDMCRRPAWMAAMNRLHDLVLARQWIHYLPVEQAAAWLEEAGLTLQQRTDCRRLWYGHELRVFARH
jgi:2-polyprenyl-3-methyl-5-hydroxy-6-metoxy-1,4-benzoquinol methylase